jgi:hypothetical protein
VCNMGMSCRHRAFAIENGLYEVCPSFDGDVEFAIENAGQAYGIFENALRVGRRLPVLS